MPPLDPSHESKLTAIPSTDPSRADDLGLPAPLLAALRATLTCVIHAAWPVNFTLPVRAYAPHVAGLHALLQLCLRVRPARLYFASSVAATGGLAALPTAQEEEGTVLVPERVPGPLAAAQKTGYGRSKLVGEKVVRAAAETTGIRARSLRIGQLVGDVGGAGDWNGTEAIPLLVRGVVRTGVVPALEEVSCFCCCSWWVCVLTGV